MIPHCPNDGGTSRPRRLARAGRPGGLTPNPDRTRVIPWTCRPSGASGRGSDLDRPRDLMRAPPKASVTVASQRQRVRHRLPLRGKERTCRSRPRKPAPSSEASALVRTCTVPLRRGRGSEPDTTSAPRPSRRPGPTSVLPLKFDAEFLAVQDRGDAIDYSPRCRPNCVMCLRDGTLVWRLANLWHKCSRSCGGSIGRSGPPGKGRSSRCR